jgi:hypothetical protein
VVGYDDYELENETENHFCKRRLDLLRDNGTNLTFWTTRTRTSRRLLTLGLIAIAGFAQESAPPKGAVRLDLVMEQVKKALAEYQDNLGKGADALPPLSSAAFDFKATTTTKVGLTVNLLIFTLGGSHEKDVINDVTYTFSVPKPKKAQTELESSAPPPELKDDLAKTIQSAAMAVKTSGKLGNLSFTKLTIDVQYGVKWDGSAGVNAPISLVTIGLNGEKSKNTVQSVKLTFGE